MIFKNEENQNENLIYKLGENVRLDNNVLQLINYYKIKFN